MWEPIRQRLKVKGSRLRHSDASFLVYSLLDANLDHCFPILEHFGDYAEELEIRVLEQAQRNTINDIHQLKRDLLLMRRNIWPLREVIANLQREPHECICDATRVTHGSTFEQTSPFHLPVSWGRRMRYLSGSSFARQESWCISAYGWENYHPNVRSHRKNRTWINTKKPASADKRIT